MELASKYDPQAVESKWYQYWLCLLYTSDAADE